MQVDWYTKVILTIIAMCLVVGLAKDLTPPAHAAPGVQQVDIVRVNGLSIVGGVPVTQR